AERSGNDEDAPFADLADRAHQLFKHTIGDVETRCPPAAGDFLSHLGRGASYSGNQTGFVKRVAKSRCSPSARQTNSMIAATKHKIFEMMFSASGSGSAGKATPNAAQTANTTNIPATA